VKISRPTVSVVLPVFNAGSTLERAVVSLQAQSLADWELIAVDDGSTDRSGECIARLAQADPRIRPIFSGHGGVHAAANRAHAEARGDFIARMDADDEAHPDRFARQVEVLQADPGLDFVGCQVRFGGDPKVAEGFAGHVDWLNRILSPTDHEHAQFLEYPLANPTLFGRRAAWERVGPYGEGPFPEDYEWFLRAMELGCRFAKVPETLLTWNDPPMRLTRTDPRYAVEAFFAVKIPFLARWLLRQLPADRPVLVWGAGRISRQRLSPLLAYGLAITGWIDIDPAKVGGQAEGLPVHSPEVLEGTERPFVLAAVRSRGARELIESHLRKLGFAPAADFLALA